MRQNGQGFLNEQAAAEPAASADAHARAAEPQAVRRSLQNMKIQNRAGLDPEELAKLQASLSGVESLADVIAWGRTQPAGSVRPEVITDVVVQDEYTHDAIVPWNRRVLVFGST